MERKESYAHISCHLTRAILDVDGGVGIFESSRLGGIEWGGHALATGSARRGRKPGCYVT